MTSLQFIKWICIYKPATLKSIVGIFFSAVLVITRSWSRDSIFSSKLRITSSIFLTNSLCCGLSISPRIKAFKGFSDMNLAEASLSLDAESHLASSSSVAAPGVKYPYIPPYGLRVPVQRPTRLHQL